MSINTREEVIDYLISRVKELEAELTRRNNSRVIYDPKVMSDKIAKVIVNCDKYRKEASVIHTTPSRDGLIVEVTI